MKTSIKVLLALLIPVCFIGKNARAQNTFPSTGSAGIGTTTPNASSILEMKSTTQGMLIPRMTLAQRNAIVSPATSLMIYQTNNTPGFYYYTGSGWTASKPKAWNLTGNGGTNAATNFIGTTDAQPLQFKVNNTKAGWLDYNSLTANTSFGFQSLNSNSAANNTGFGYQSLFSNTTGRANVANGVFALYSNVSDYNVATGYKALYSNTGGYANTATGFQTLLSNTGGILNTGTGSEALFSNTTGSYNTATGYQALFSNITGNDNTAMGLDALHYNTTGSFNTATGRDALRNNTTGNYNTANGYEALYNNTTGSSNAALGVSALRSNVIGNNNTACGVNTLYYNTTASQNIAIGKSALFTQSYNPATGSEWISGNVAVGYNALYANQPTSTANGTYNIAVGFSAMRFNTTGNENTANGNTALYYNTTGNNNTAIGAGALYFNTAGHNNTANGYNALLFNTTGNYNSALGRSAYFADGTVDNASCIGYGSGGVVSASNRIELGNTSVSVIAGQVGFSTYSDARIKDNVKEDVPGLAFIKKLRPVTYNLNIHRANEMVYKGTPKDEGVWRTKYDIEKIKMTGFLGQDVEKAAKESGYDFSGVQKPANPDELYSIRYSDFVMPLVKAVQELSAANDAKDAKIDSQDKKIDRLEQMVLTLQQTFNSCNPCAQLSTISNQQSESQQHQTPNAKQANSALEQNIPNPFNHSTTINYVLPSTYSSAKIIVVDKSGKVLKEVNISGSGKGSLKLDASTLASGAYNYSLYINGKLIDTKQMILTK